MLRRLSGMIFDCGCPSTHLRDLEVIKNQGQYSALRLATTRAFERLKGLLDAGIRNLEEAEGKLNDQIALRTKELQNGVQRAEQEWVSTKEQMKSCDMPLMTGLLIVSLILLFISKPPFSNVVSGAFSVIGLIIGTVWLWTAGSKFVRFFTLESKAQSLASQVSQARNGLQPGVDEALQKLESHRTVVQQHGRELNDLLSEMLSRKPAKLLP